MRQNRLLVQKNLWTMKLTFIFHNGILRYKKKQYNACKTSINKLIFGL